MQRSGAKAQAKPGAPAAPAAPGQAQPQTQKVGA